MKKSLPIGMDSFEKVREGDYYYVDKTLMIREFLEMRDEAALIARPRRFGKTLNMTMLREFFDITKDSHSLFQGLAIMDTRYADGINTLPVIYVTFKDCKGQTPEELLIMLKRELAREYARYASILAKQLNPDTFSTKQFFKMVEILSDRDSSYPYLATALQDLCAVLCDYYKKKVILLIDGYDQPIMSSYEYGYHQELGTFFSNFYGSAMKGNEALGQALLTGVQRVAKESIFSQFNNPQVYTVGSRPYAEYFGLTQKEASALLQEYGLSLNEEVKNQYDGYRIGGISLYNPWSILNYAKSHFLDNYWLNTSANFLVKQALKNAGKNFWNTFDTLASGNESRVWLTLDTSYAERSNDYSLWGLLVNAGYLTIINRPGATEAIVKIPNDEVMSEFQLIVSELSGIDHMDLSHMFNCLIKKDMDEFFRIYENIVIACTSYMDAKENAYHMLFLGMCLSLRGTYCVTSNIESGYGRSDITMKSQKEGLPNIIVEFKLGDNLEQLKEEALQQILEQKYYIGLSGEIICVGLAHNKKKCSMSYKTLMMP